MSGFKFSEHQISPEYKQEMIKLGSWREGCIPVQNLVLLELSYIDYSRQHRIGQLVVNKSIKSKTINMFRDLFNIGFPIAKMQTIEAYSANDEASMQDNNTSGFNCRNIAGTNIPSSHSDGRAIDINPLVNPHVTLAGFAPRTAGIFLNRDLNQKGMIKGNSAATEIFSRNGMSWGGYWELKGSTGPDYQHVYSDR